MRRDDDVDGAVGDRLDHCHTVVFGPQRRRQLEEGAVLTDVILVERQMVDRNAAGDLGATTARHTDRFRRFGHGDLGGVELGTGQPGDPEIPFERDDLGLLRHAGQAEPAGEQTGIHHAVSKVIFARL